MKASRYLVRLAGAVVLVGGLAGASAAQHLSDGQALPVLQQKMRYAQDQCALAQAAKRAGKKISSLMELACPEAEQYRKLYDSAQAALKASPQQTDSRPSRLTPDEADCGRCDVYSQRESLCGKDCTYINPYMAGGDAQMEECTARANRCREAAERAFEQCLDRCRR